MGGLSSPYAVLKPPLIKTHSDEGVGERGGSTLILLPSSIFANGLKVSGKVSEIIAQIMFTLVMKRRPFRGCLQIGCLGDLQC